MKVSRILARATGLALAGLLSVSVVSMAGAPKFHAVTSSVTNSGALAVSFDERGLGNENVDYTLTADSTALYACINRGGHNPSAANKQSFKDDVSGGGSFEVKNGRVQGTIIAGPISAGSFSCPGGQKLVLASVSYTNIVLTDTTNGVQASAPDASREYFAV